MKIPISLALIPLVAFGAIAANGAAVRAATPTQPNIVLILIDDLGYGDVAPFGSTKAKTPALDRMAREGTKFTSFYAAPVCSASRAQIQTGSYAPRVSIPAVLPPSAAVGLNPTENTVAKQLRALGYATMCIGKWHLGDQPEFLPMQHGYDHYYGIPYSNDMLRPKVEGGTPLLPLVRDDRVEALWPEDAQDQMTKRYTEEAVKFITANRDHPFFLYLPHSAVHFPIHPSPEFQGHSGHGRYYDWVEEIDWSAGRVLDTLRELHLDKNTLVIFTSDNGPWLAKGGDAGSAGPLRGGKGSTWEGGMRESTFAWWPGRVPAGRVTDAVAGEIDLLPTFVALAGGVAAKDKPIDGADMSALLLGQSDASPRAAHYYYHGYHLEAVRVGAWKLALKPQGFSMGFKEDAQHRGEAQPGLRLYNLDTDIGETTDVAAKQPAVVARLKALAEQQAISLCDGSAKGAGVRPPGRVDQPKFLYPVDADAVQRAEKFNRASLQQ